MRNQKIIRDLSGVSLFAGRTAMGTKLPFVIQQITAATVLTGYILLLSHPDSAKQQKSDDITEQQNHGWWAQKEE